MSPKLNFPKFIQTKQPFSLKFSLRLHNRFFRLASDNSVSSRLIQFFKISVSKLILIPPSTLLPPPIAKQATPLQLPKIAMVELQTTRVKKKMAKVFLNTMDSTFVSLPKTVTVAAVDGEKKMKLGFVIDLYVGLKSWSNINEFGH